MTRPGGRSFPMRPEALVAGAANAFALTASVVLGLATLLGATYRVTTCFSRPDGFGGCGTVLHPFSVEAVPALTWPVALFAGLTLLAALAWHTHSTKLAAVATTAFAALAGGTILLVAPLLSVPVALLVLAFALRTGRNLRHALADLAIAISLTTLAIASAYTLLFGATLWRGGWLGGIAPAMWLYVAFAAAVALGVGCAPAAPAAAAPFPFARGPLAAFRLCGRAGVVALCALPGRAAPARGAPAREKVLRLRGGGWGGADRVTPGAAPQSAARTATRGVGSTPASRTSTPAEANPAMVAAARNSPEARGSRPTTALGR